LLAKRVKAAAPKPLGEGGRAVRELRLGKPSCDINGKDSRKADAGSRFQLKYRKQPHAK
jgi:hypothetical protein